MKLIHEILQAEDFHPQLIFLFVFIKKNIKIS